MITFLLAGLAVIAAVTAEILWTHRDRPKPPSNVIDFPRSNVRRIDGGRAS